MTTNEIITALLCVTLTPDQRTHKCDETCPYYTTEVVDISGEEVVMGGCDYDRISKDAVAHIMELEAHIEELENER